MSGYKRPSNLFKVQFVVLLCSLVSIYIICQAFFTMVRPRAVPITTRSSTQREDLSVLSSEVLQLRLQALKLPITGSKGQLLARLRTALSGMTGSESTRDRASRGTKGKTRKPRAPRAAATRQRPSVRPAPSWRRASSLNIQRTAPYRTTPHPLR